MSDTQKDIMASAWNDPNIAEKYKIGENATRPFAEIMTKKAGLETYKGNLKILDVGTGTGAVIAQIYKRLGDRQDGVEVLASDISESMLQYVRERGQKEGWKGLNTGTVDGAVSVASLVLLHCVSTSFQFDATADSIGLNPADGAPCSGIGRFAVFSDSPLLH